MYTSFIYTLVKCESMLQNVVFQKGVKFLHSDAEILEMPNIMSNSNMSQPASLLEIRFQ